MELRPKELKLNYGDLLVCDPCYIRFVGNYYAKENKCPRYDALKLVKEFALGGDGDVALRYGDEGFTRMVGADTGRVWAMQAEFKCDVFLDASIEWAGYFVIKNGNAKLLKEME